MSMAPLVYALCALAALGCAVLLGRAYQRSGVALLLWSALCFLCLTLNNSLVVVDLIVLPEVNLFVMRQMTALVGMFLLLYGLIWDSR